MLVAIIPKRYRTFNKCIEALLNRPERSAFQSELKRIVYSKSWRKVVKREINLWNSLISKYFEGIYLVAISPMRNPRTCKTNEVLFKIHPKIEIKNEQSHFLVTMNEVMKVG